MEIKFKPCEKFIKNSPGDQLTKIWEEVIEMQNALGDYERKSNTKGSRDRYKALMSEVLDVAQAAVTMAVILSDKKGKHYAYPLEQALKDLKVKNQERGYYG